MSEQNIIGLSFDETKFTESQRKVLAGLDEVYKAAKKIDALRPSLKGIEGYADLKKATSEIEAAHKQAELAVNALNNTISEQDKIITLSSAKTKKGVGEQVSEYKKLKQAAEAATSEAKNLAAEYGAYSEQAQKAAEKARGLKDQIKEIDNLFKGSGGKEAEIPYTNNLEKLAEEAKNTGAEIGDTLNDLEREQIDAAMSANEWASAQAGATRETKEQSQAVQRAVGYMDEYLGSIHQNIEAQDENKQALADNKSAQKELQKEINDAGKATQDQKERMLALRTEELQLNEIIKTLNVTIRNQSKELVADAGSIDELQARVNLLQHAYEQLGEQERDSDFGKELKSQIDTLEPKVKSLEGTIGKHQRNVGNYSDALKYLGGRYKELPALIERVTKTSGSNSDAVQALNSEYETLGSILENRATGFAGFQQEIKANTLAMQQLEAAGLKDTEMYKGLFETTAELKDRFNDIKEELKAQADDQSFVDKLANDVKELTAAWQVGEGALVLFGVSTDAVEESIARLSAVQNVANGIFELQEELKRKGSFTNGIYIATQRLITFVTTGRIKAVVAETAAEEANMVATEANTVATEAQAVATTSTTAATRGATIAMIGLRAALIATGIGAIVYGLYLLADRLDAFGNKAEKAAEEQKKLADALKAANSALLAQNDALADAQGDVSTALKNEISLREKAGVTAAQQIANRKALAELDRNNANVQLNNLGLTESGIDKLDAKIFDSNKKIERLQKAKQQAISDDRDRLVDAIDKEIEATQSQIDSQQELVTKGKALLKQRNDAQQEAFEADAEAAKMNADDRVKIALESATLSANAVIDANSRILGNEKSTFDERLAAMRAISNEQKKIAKAELDSTLADNTRSNADKLIDQKKYAYQVNKITKDSLDAQEKLRKEYENRALAAQLAVLKLRAEDNIAFNEAIISNDQAAAQNRIMAVKYSSDRQKDIIEAQYQFERKTKTLTNEELVLLDAQRDIQLIQLAQSTQKRITEVIKSENQKRQSDALLVRDNFIQFIQQTSQADLDNSDQYAEDVRALTESLAKKKISIEQYETQKAEIERKYSEASIDRQIEIQQRLIDYLRSQGESTLEAEIKLNDLKVQKDTQTTEKIIANRQKIREAEKELMNEVIGLFETLVTAGYDKEKNAITEKQRLNDETYARQIENIKNSSLSEQQKADQVKVLEAEQAANQKRFEAQQKEVDQRRARFEKAMAIARIVQNTAIGVTSALAQFPPNPILAAIIGAIGAVQIASVLARPIPAYAEGTDNHPGGWALVGERKDRIPERVDMPGGKSFITDGPMFANLPAGTSVTPLTGDVVDEFMYSSMMRETVRRQQLITGAAANTGKDDLMYMAAWLAGRFDKAIGKTKSGKNELVIKYNPDFQVWKNRNILGRK